MNKELIKEFQENPEKLVEFLKNFEIETLAQSVKDVLTDYCMGNKESRSMFFMLETDDSVVGCLGGFPGNILNSLLNMISGHPEIERLIQDAAAIMSTDEHFQQSENISKVEPNKLKS